RRGEVEARDAAAHPAQLAVREAPHEMAEIEAAGPVRPLFDLHLRVAPLVRIGHRRAKARELHGSLEPEILREVERVRAAGEPVRGVEIGAVPAAHAGELVAERLREEALLHAAIMPAADELLLQLFVDALRAGLARPQR